jgi:hydroxyacylglutathione hydrolase
MKTEKIHELQNNIFMIAGSGNSSHSYVVKGDRLNVLIDSGLDGNFSGLQECLLKIGLKVRDVDIVINTHEHFDHIGANRYFQEHAIIAAHRFAATKIAMNDRYVTLYKSGDANKLSLYVHVWLESKSRFDLGNYTLDVIHTPGHTSGSVCIYEPVKKFLFAGDTLFAGGALSYIAESGSVGDYINSIMSLNTRQILEIYPGHGEISVNPTEDIKAALENARQFLSKDEEVKIIYEKDFNNTNNSI